MNRVECAECNELFCWPQDMNAICTSCNGHYEMISEKQKRFNSIISTVWLLEQLDVIKRRPDNFACYDYMHRIFDE